MDCPCWPQHVPQLLWLSIVSVMLDSCQQLAACCAHLPKASHQAPCTACRCEQLRWILPDWVPHKWLNLFTQPWEGDVTMTLPASMWNLGRTITNPNSEELLMAVRVSAAATWAEGCLHGRWYTWPQQGCHFRAGTSLLLCLSVLDTCIIATLDPGHKHAEHP
jgi:hypothetical protein